MAVHGQTGGPATPVQNGLSGGSGGGTGLQPFPCFKDIQVDQTAGQGNDGGVSSGGDGGGPFGLSGSGGGGDISSRR